VTDPLSLSFEVGCAPDRAFALWTDRIDTWWPSDHTVTGGPDLTVVLESGVGGRIFERTSDGVEHDWGEVTVWDPPGHLAYRWHLRRDRADATEVSVRFVADGGGGTRVEIEHAGWERLGADGATWRSRNEQGWRALVPHYVAATTTPTTIDAACTTPTTEEDQP
jgi:uncharacterized protein YndB with AHSA1/START domain